MIIQPTSTPAIITSLFTYYQWDGYRERNTENYILIYYLSIIWIKNNYKTKTKNV